jgi:type III secretory pathway component EscU
VEEVIMRLIRDLVMTVGDALRLSGDLMRYKVEMQTRIIKRVLNRLTMYVAFFLASVILAGVGAGFILYGIFVLLARAINSAGAAGLILGFVLLLVAIATAITGRSMFSRP